MILYSCDIGFDSSGDYTIGIESDTEQYIMLDEGEIINGHDSLKERIKKCTYVKYHSRSGKVDTLIEGKEDAIIDSFIDKIKFDSTFMIVDQKPLDSIFGVFHIIGDSINGSFSRSIVPTKDILDKSTFHQYWIINQKTDDVYGPFNKNEFYIKKKELGVKLEFY